MTVGIFLVPKHQKPESTYISSISVVCGGFLHLSTARFLSSLPARSLHLGFQNGHRPLNYSVYAELSQSNMYIVFSRLLLTELCFKNV